MCEKTQQTFLEADYAYGTVLRDGDSKETSQPTK